PRMTQVPPKRELSAIATLAPCPAAMRAARTPPEPAPITKKSKSKSVMRSPRLPSPPLARSFKRGLTSRRVHSGNSRQLKAPLRPRTEGCLGLPAGQRDLLGPRLLRRRDQLAFEPVDSVGDRVAHEVTHRDLIFGRRLEAHGPDETARVKADF